MSVTQSQIQSGNDIELSSELLSWLGKPRLHALGGEFTQSQSERFFNTISPATETPLSRVAQGEEPEIERAVGSAKHYFENGQWARSSVEERARVLNQIGDGILAHRENLALLESLDTGKPIRESYEGDIVRAAANFHFFARFATNETSPSFPKGDILHRAMREPLGVVALITPWNLPLYLETWKLAPALVMGNSVVLKPSEFTPLMASYLFEEILPNTDLPTGVCQLVHGFGEKAAGEFLVSHPEVSAVSFTGETRTGQAIMRSAAAGPARVSFEMGGKGASIIFEDADIDKAVETTLRAAFRNQGEICLASPRIYVHEAVAKSFTEAFVEKAKALRVGNPLNWNTQMGALIGKEHSEKVYGYLDTLKTPAKVLCGGTRPSDREKGYFLSPTVVSGVSEDHPVTQEEIFGPIAAIYPFSDEGQVISAVNATKYGLSASVWTNDMHRAHRVVRGIRSGLVWVNCWFVRDFRVPFGGQKASGLGREGGQYSLDFYSDWKSVCYQFEGE